MNGAIICLLIQICLFYELNNPSQRRYTSVKLAKLQGFMQPEYEKKIIQWSPLCVVFNGKIKIAHLLPERSPHQADHFLRIWPHLSRPLD